MDQGETPEVVSSHAADGAEGNDPVRRASGANVAKWSVWALLSLGLQQLYVVVSSAVVARYLGASQFGRIALILSLQGALMVTFTWGVPDATIRYVGSLFGARRFAEARGVNRWGYRQTSAGAVASFLILLAFAVGGADPQAAWYLAAVTVVFQVMHAVPSAFLVGAQRWREARTMGISTGLLSVIAKVAVVVGGGGIVSLFVVDLCVAAANFCGTSYLASRAKRGLPPPEFPPELRREVRNFALISTFVVLVNFTIYQRTEVFVLARYRTSADIARYTVPFSLITALLLIPTAMATVLAPAFATLLGSGERDRMRVGYSRVLRLISRLTLAFAGLAIVAGQNVIRLIYGAQFGHVRIVVLILSLSLPFVPYASISMSLLRALNRLRVPTIIGGTAALADIGLSFLLIPHFGIEGAATANVLAQLVWSIPLAAYAGRQIGGIDLGWPSLARTASLLAVATAAGTLLSERLAPAPGLLVGVGVFVAILAAAARPARILSRDDAGWIAETLGARLRPISAAARYAGGL
jgi:O-antigen/teichoic acid export membrane protein